jgi:hypothetical protein
MKHPWALAYCLLSTFIWAAEPQLRVQAHLSGSNPVVVGATLQLQVDVLVDTWFTGAPQLPELTLSGATVIPPGGEAQHLTQTVEGKTLFGLRYTYLITPSVAQAFDIPALSVRVTPGQANAEQTAHSEPISFNAQLPPGFSPGETVLAAHGLRFSQQLRRSADPLRIGDSITRELTLQVDGALALSLPIPALVEVQHLRRYLADPQIKSLDDGRGNLSGAQRVDSANYRIDHPGTFSLPAIQLKWWDIDAKQVRMASVPAIDFEAFSGSLFKPVFSVAADLQQLGEESRFHLSRHWLGLVCTLIILGALGFFARTGWQRGRHFWQGWRSARQLTWLASADYAWQQIPEQLEQSPPQLSALYLWAHRSQQQLGLLGLVDSPQSPLSLHLQRLLRACYGQKPDGPRALQQLKNELPKLRDRSALHPRHNAARFHLRPLNPSQKKELP